MCSFVNKRASLYGWIIRNTTSPRRFLLTGLIIKNNNQKSTQRQLSVRIAICSAEKKYLPNSWFLHLLIFVTLSRFRLNKFIKSRLTFTQIHLMFEDILGKSYLAEKSRKPEFFGWSESRYICINLSISWNEHHTNSQTLLTTIEHLALEKEIPEALPNHVMRNYLTLIFRMSSMCFEKKVLMFFWHSAFKKIYGVI